MEELLSSDTHSMFRSICEIYLIRGFCKPQISVRKGCHHLGAPPHPPENCVIPHEVLFKLTRDKQKHAKH